MESGVTVLSRIQEGQHKVLFWHALFQRAHILLNKALLNVANSYSHLIAIESEEVLRHYIFKETLQLYFTKDGLLHINSCFSPHCFFEYLFTAENYWKFRISFTTSANMY